MSFYSSAVNLYICCTDPLCIVKLTAVDGHNVNIHSLISRKYFTLVRVDPQPITGTLSVSQEYIWDGMPV